jgi:ribosomal protein S21
MAIVVRAGNNGNTDQVIRSFQKKIITEKVIQEYRDLMYHKNNQEIKKEKRAEKYRKIQRAKRLSNS